MSKETDIETLELGVKSAKVASLVALTQVVSTVISGIALIVLARLLQPEQYGIYTLAFSTSLIFSVLGTSGIGHYLNKYIPVWTARRKKDELKKDLGTSFLTLACICIAAILVGIAFSGTISEYVFHSTAYVLLIDLALASIISTQLMFLSYNTLIGFRDGTGSAVTYSLGTLAIAAGSIGLVVMGYGVYGAIGGSIAGSIIGLITGLFFILKHSGMALFTNDFWARARRILGFSLPVAGAGIVGTFMNNFSILYLGVFSSAALIGSFGVAYRIGTLVVAAAGFISSVLIQMFSSALEGRKPDEKIGKLWNYSIYFAAVIVSPIAVYLIVMAHPFVTSLFPEYKSSLLYTPALSISLLIGIVGSYATSLLISLGEVKRVLRYALIGGVVQFALLVPLVPLLSAYGVIASVYLAGSLVSDYLFLRYVSNNLHVRTKWGGALRAVLASLILALALAPITLLAISETLQLIAALAVVVVLYPILLGVTGSMGAREIRIVRAIGKGVPVLGKILDLFGSYVSFFSG